MEFNAVILAGGRATRLGGVPKPSLKYDGDTLLSHALQAARGASAVVVVGPDTGPEDAEELINSGQADGGGQVPGKILRAREEPVFAGPAAAIAAGLAELKKSGPRAPWTLVLACDMPHASRGVDLLWAALESSPGVEGAMAVSSDGRKQPLLGAYSTAALDREVAVASAGAGLTNSSVFRLLARLNLLDVEVPAGSTDDVDTWEDAAALGIDYELEADVKSQEETLEEWCRTLLQAFELEGVEVDINEVLAVAGVAAHSVVRPAAPLTTFIAGYAAGMARGIGQASDDASMNAALELARRIAKEYSETGTGPE
ncbi:NTP transferase domain-containing protein [Paenarthrobacter aurescens]|uniref:Molybdenum cofactor guanylyltransferase n=1 Tax=Paenarthrobacter aurescens TaxID=43663 RepID=A0A4Y3NJZ3_PAEAU|nr:NTP transferase domain-containing protein [Paenarthrobacter aurescens]MDO6142605.1 NTP transferase domain-containing protein [Paenarthrobacter aurescens]MDO6146452.1 NTP transferase domain-containing protein [Paenarthrobacter aurescens]MDO6157697.1 NTP transferase domain-containing protein [Paenarthrobacter aurescens]MDO6161682.1 NTP transferase domain-containing protein [Paenarthrobacter aurescens]GEB20775.1 molybdenum cofactor guanylyltransferase [Paenarthrobacter aurescens]